MSEKQKAIEFIQMLKRKIVDAEEILRIRPEWVKECGVRPSVLQTLIEDHKQVCVWGGIERLHRVLEHAANHKENHKEFGNKKAKSIKAVSMPNERTTYYWQEIPLGEKHILIKNLIRIVKDVEACL